MEDAIVPPICCGQHMGETEDGFTCKKCGYVVKVSAEDKEAKYRVKVELTKGGLNG